METDAMRELDKPRADLLPLDVIASVTNSNRRSMLFTDFENVRYHIRNLEESDYKHMESTFITLIRDIRDTMFNHSWYEFDAALAQRMTLGAKKYAPDNWRKGIPCWSYLSSLIRHTDQWFENMEDEDHAAAAAFNACALAWTWKHCPEMRGAE
jgi:hypothetical protein